MRFVTYVNSTNSICKSQFHWYSYYNLLYVIIPLTVQLPIPPVKLLLQLSEDCQLH